MSYSKLVFGARAKFTIFSVVIKLNAVASWLQQIIIKIGEKQKVV